jgi:hypothetical protein
MPSPSSKRELLQHIVTNLRHEPRKDGPMTVADLQALRLHKGSMGPGGVYGIRVEAAEALDQFAEAIFTGSPFQRNTTFDSFVGQLTNVIITGFIGRATVPVQDSDVAVVPVANSI